MLLLNLMRCVDALNDVDYKWDETTAAEFGFEPIPSSQRATCDYFTASGQYEACSNDRKTRLSRIDNP